MIHSVTISGFTKRNAQLENNKIILMITMLHRRNIPNYFKLFPKVVLRPFRSTTFAVEKF